jgi:hypothetical protein
MTSRRERKEFYQLRSAILHGGELIGRDEDLSFGGLYPRRWDQRNIDDQMRRVCQIALINYLLSGSAIVTLPHSLGPRPFYASAEVKQGRPPQ